MSLKRFDWLGLASKAIAALLIVLSGSLGIALLADFFIFSNGGTPWTWPST